MLFNNSLSLYVHLTFLWPPICFANLLAKSHFAIARLIFLIQASDKACPALNRLYQWLVNSHRCIATSSSSSFDENFTRTIRQVHFACIPHGNYMTWMRRGAWMFPDDQPASGKGSFNLAPHLHSREWTTSRERRIPCRPEEGERIVLSPGYLEFNVRP